jgi:hypothetical protein
MCSASKLVGRKKVRTKDHWAVVSKEDIGCPAKTFEQPSFEVLSKLLKLSGHSFPISNVETTIVPAGCRCCET